MSNHNDIKEVDTNTVIELMRSPTVSPYLSTMKVLNDKIVIKEFKSNSDNKDGK